MATADYKVFVAWDGGTAFTASADDLTSRTYDAVWERGRDFASQLQGRSIAGRLRLTVDNRSGDYNSFNSSSPIAGSILPGRHVRMQMDPTGNGTFTTVWQGFLNSLRPSPSILGRDTVTIEAIGPLGYINQKSVSVPMLSSVVTSSAIGTILDEAAWPAGDRTLATGQTTMTRFWADKQKTLNALRLVESTEAGFLYEGKDGTIGFEDRHTRLKAPHTTSTATFTDSATGTLVYARIIQEDPLPFIYNEFEAEVITYSTGTGTVLWTHPESGADSPDVDVSETKTFWATFPNNQPIESSAGDLTDRLAIAADSWTDPTSGVDYIANSQAGGGGTDLTTALDVTVTKFSTAMKIEIQNTGTAAAFLTTLQAKGVPLYQNDPALVTVADSTSQTAFGERTFRNRSRFIPNTDEADSWARYNLGIYKDPVPILSMSYVANKDGSHLAQAVEREISDRITLVATGSAGLGIEEPFYIEHERHRIDSRRTHTVSYRLSPVADFAGFWVLGVGELGTSTRLAYALLAPFVGVGLTVMSNLTGVLM